MAVRNSDNPHAEVEQATAAPGEKRGTPSAARDTGTVGSEPDQPKRAGGVDGAADQADARAAADLTPGKVSGVPVGESSDPAVHQLMAERETARINGDEDGMKAVDDRLKKAGYTIG